MKHPLVALLLAALMMLMYVGIWAEFQTSDGVKFSLSHAGFVTDNGLLVADVQPYFKFQFLVGLNALLFLLTLLFRHQVKRRAIFLQVSLMLVVGIFAFAFISSNSFVGYLGGSLEIEVERTWLFYMPLAVFALGYAHYAAIVRKARN